MRVLVTGGAGFIGSNLVRALLEDASEVLVVDNLSVGKRENLDDRAGFVHLDILDARLGGVFADFAPEVVVHLAAQASVTVSVANPEFDRRVNVDGTRAVAHAARDEGARLILSASSAAVYGEPEVLPLSEGSRKLPINPYGSSKLEAESVLADVLADSETDHACLRFANVYGPRQDAAGEGGVVAMFLSAATRCEPLPIFGDGEQSRDFIFVGDVVRGLIAAGSAGIKLADSGPAYNISTGRSTTVNELARAVDEASGCGLKPTYQEPREGDIKHSVLDPARAREAFGWSAETDLRSGVASTWDWWKTR